MLLLRRHLSEGSAIAFQGDEHRVVAEASVTGRSLGDHALDLADSEELGPVREGHVGDRLESSMALGRVAELGEELGDVVVIGGVLSSIASRPDPRRTPQRIDDKAGVIGDCCCACRLAQRHRLQPSVLKQRVAGLLDLSHVRGSIHEFDPARSREDLDDLLRLVGIRCGEDQSDGHRGLGDGGVAKRCACAWRS